MDSLPRPWRSVHDGNPRFESSNAHRPGRGLVLRSRFTVAKSDARFESPFPGFRILCIRTAAILPGTQMPGCCREVGRF